MPILYGRIPSYRHSLIGVRCVRLLMFRQRLALLLYGSLILCRNLIQHLSLEA